MLCTGEAGYGQVVLDSEPLIFTSRASKYEIELYTLIPLVTSAACMVHKKQWPDCKSTSKVYLRQ